MEHTLQESVVALANSLRQYAPATAFCASSAEKLPAAVQSRLFANRREYMMDPIVFADAAEQFMAEYAASQPASAIDTSVTSPPEVHAMRRFYPQSAPQDEDKDKYEGPYYWCAKCNRYTRSHSTSQHKGKDIKKGRGNKQLNGSSYVAYSGESEDPVQPRQFYSTVEARSAISSPYAPKKILKAMWDSGAKHQRC